MPFNQAHTVPKDPMTTTQPPATPGSSARRLGQVLRFSPGAAAKGLKWLDAQGLSVASSRDFGDPNVPVPHDFQGADAQYFERFGIVVVRNGFERLETTLSKVLDSKVLDAHRKELSYGVTDTSDYLRGYRDGVSDLAGRMLDSSDETASDVLEAAADDTNGMGKNGAWALETLRVPSSQLSGAGIRVAILDTGLSESHPDFKGREVVRKRFASVDSTDDLSGHGTRCAGLACGPRVPTGGAPRYGVAYDAEIYAGKISGDDEKATDRSIIAGLHWALDQRCQVVSLSFGSPTDMGDVPNDYYEDIGRTCLDAGTLLIASAGNASSRPKSIAPITSPANASTVMAVGASMCCRRPSPSMVGTTPTTVQATPRRSSLASLRCLPSRTRPTAAGPCGHACCRRPGR
jgi:subtilisin family serine protease